MRSIATSVRRKSPRNIELDDLIAYGQVGLAQAARDFDPHRGNTFSTYAYYRIRGAIYDGLSKLSWTSRARYNRLRYEQMANEVTCDHNDEEPWSEGKSSVGQDAHWLGSLSEKLAVVYFTTIGEPRAQGSSLMLADTSEPTPSDQVATEELSQKIHAMVDSLPAQAADLVRSTYFEGLTLQEAGKRLGISKSWASRVHAKALQQLARSLKLVGITD